MWHHFWDVAEARDAVISGELERSREPFTRLAAEPAAGVDGGGAMGQLRVAAARGRTATTLAQAGLAVAQVAGQCAACHEATAGGPKLEGDVAGFPTAEQRGLGEAMLRHVWAAEELWLGLTVPREDAWQRGARALAETALPSDVTPESAAASRLEERLAAVWELGERAQRAEAPADRVALYGELITACGDCHLSMNVRVEPLLGATPEE